MEQSGTKSILVAKILATKFGFVPDCGMDQSYQSHSAPVSYPTIHHNRTE